MSTHADPQPAAKPYAQILHESGDFALEWDRVQEWGKAKYADMAAALLAEFQHRQFQPIHAAPYGRPILVWQENNTLPIIAVRERARPVSEFAPAPELLKSPRS